MDKVFIITVRTLKEGGTVGRHSAAYNSREKAAVAELNILSTLLRNHGDFKVVPIRDIIDLGLSERVYRIEFENRDVKTRVISVGESEIVGEDCELSSLTYL